MMVASRSDIELVSCEARLAFVLAFFDGSLGLGGL
jgi:hypothetical protein